MAVSELDQVIEASRGVLTALGPALNGTGEEVQRAYRALMDTATAMPSAALTARSEMERIAGDDSLPKDHRARVIKEQQETASTLIEKLREASYLQETALETALQNAIKPRVAADPMTRMLKRQEAQQLVARAGGKVANLVRLLGGDPQVDAELLDSYGRAMLTADDHGALAAAALGRYMADENGGNDRQRAAKAALRLFYKANVKGRIAGFHEAGRMALQ